MKDVVLLVQLGGAKNQKEVFRFTYNLLSDPEIIRLPGVFRRPLAFGIALLRNPVIRRRYQEINGSPIVKITHQQASLLQEEFEKRGKNIEVLFANRHSQPYIKDVLGEQKWDRCVVLPLFPHYSFTTVKTCVDEAVRVAEQIHPGGKCIRIEGFYRHPKYIKAMVDSINAATGELDRPYAILFSAHGLPKGHVEAGDPYIDQIEESVALIKERLPEKTAVFLGYQSRMSKRWVRPSIDDVLKEIIDQGITGIVVVPISFVSEHFETLYELDIEYRQKALSMGFKQYIRLPTLNTNETFINMLADLVLEKLL